MIKLIQQTKTSYEKIASPFSASRKQIWPVMEGFAQEIAKGSLVLDLGCGNGRILELLKQTEIEYLGIDFCEPLLEEARKLYPETKFELLDFTKDLNKLSKSDYIVSIAALHHIPTKALRLKVFRELKSLLRPPGKLLFTVWNLRQPKYRKYLYLSRLKNFFRYGWNDTFIPWGKQVERYYHAFSPRELKKLLQKAGFEIEKLEYDSKKHNLVVIAH